MGDRGSSECSELELNIGILIEAEDRVITRESYLCFTRRISDNNVSRIERESSARDNIGTILIADNGHGSTGRLDIAEYEEGLLCATDRIPTSIESYPDFRGIATVPDMEVSRSRDSGKEESVIRTTIGELKTGGSKHFCQDAPDAPCTYRDPRKHSRIW